MRSCPSAATFAILFLAGVLQAAATSAQSTVKTGKERLGDKASDEQRVDNCKVPPQRWGKAARPTSCAHGKAGVTH
jgi:hypothetical protein